MSKTGIVQNYCIEFIPVFKASYFSEKGAAALCSHVENLLRGQRFKAVVTDPPSQFGSLHCMRHRAEQILRGTARHITSDPTCSPCCRNLRTGAIPEETFILDSGQWAIKTPFSFILSISLSPLYTQCAITVGTVRAEEPEPVICIPIKICPGTQLLYPCDFSLIFRQMGLKRKPVPHLQLFQLFHQLIGTARSKSRCQDGMRIFVFSVQHVLYPLQRLPCRFLSLFYNIVRQFRSIFTFPIIVSSPVFSIISMRSSVASLCTVPKIHALVAALFLILSANIPYAFRA